MCSKGGNPDLDWEFLRKMKGKKIIKTNKKQKERKEEREKKNQRKVFLIFCSPFFRKRKREKTT